MSGQTEKKAQNRQGKERADDTACFIVGAGAYQGMTVRPGPGDLVIAADGGFEYLKREGIHPDVLMGDFDSLKRLPEHEKLVRFSPLKDDTDMAIAAAYGEERGYKRFILYGGLGGRLDHTLANIQVLTSLSRAGKEAYLIGEGVILTAVTSGRVTFGASAAGVLSVLCIGDQASGVWERGLLYGLSDAVLTCDRATGVSNEFTGQESSVEVENGTLLLLWDESCGLPLRRELLPCFHEKSRQMGGDGKVSENYRGAEMAELVQAGGLVEMAETLQAGEPVEMAEPPQAAKPVWTAEPAQAAEPIQTAESVRTAEPVQAAEGSGGTGGK